MFFQESSKVEGSFDVVAEAIQCAQDELIAAAQSTTTGTNISSDVDITASPVQKGPDAKDSSYQLPLYESYGYMKHPQPLPIHEWARKFPNLQLVNCQDIDRPEGKNSEKRPRTEEEENDIVYRDEHAVLRKILKEQIKKELLEIHQGKISL
jgi:hypothetical protein